MKRIYFTFVLLMFWFSAGKLQAQETEETPAIPRTTFGIALFGNSGFATMGYGGIKNDLDKPNALNQDSIKFYTVGLNSTHSVNLEIFFAKRILLRGGIGFLRSDASETARGQAKFKTNLVGGSLGFAAINKKRWLAYPYLGFHVADQSLVVKNYADEPIFFGDTEIDRNDSKTFTTTLNLLEFGIGTHYVIPKANNFVVGMELGGYYSLSGNDWKNDAGQVVANVSAPELKGGYLKVSFGIGYYKYGMTVPKDKSKPEIEKEDKKQDKNDKSAKEKKPKKDKKKKKKDTGAEDIFD